MNNQFLLLQSLHMIHGPTWKSSPRAWLDKVCTCNAHELPASQLLLLLEANKVVELMEDFVLVRCYMNWKSSVCGSGEQAFFKPKMMKQFHYFGDTNKEKNAFTPLFLLKSLPFIFANQLGHRVMSAVDNNNDNKLGFFFLRSPPSQSLVV